jgi:hypothetical protein
MKNAFNWPIFTVLALFSFLFYCCGNNEADRQSATQNPPTNDAMSTNIDTAFQQLFEEVNVVKMHLFGTTEAEPTQENYPYTGKIIEEEFMKYLGDGLQPNEVGSVYACYRTEVYNMYILRVPGESVSSNLVLAKWDNATSKLVKLYDLASIKCSEGACQQQDAWLTDLDDDRVLDLVTRSFTNDNGKISGESFAVFAQPTPGNFVKAPDSLAALAPMTSYVPHQKM